MQQRRLRPGDVLDDYCPRERRITDHAVVAMINDHIKQTRCCVCDAEHEYKDGKLPAQRRKKPQAALFTQVLEGLQGPQAARLAQPDADPDLDLEPLPEAGVTPSPLPSLPPQAPPAADVQPSSQALASGNGHSSALDVGTLVAVPVSVTEEPPMDRDNPPPSKDEGPVRRSLIRATLPRPEGQPAPTRMLPDFTIRQPNNGRGPRPGGRRHGGHQPQGQGNAGPMRFGRGGGHGHGEGHGQGQRQHGGRSHGPNGGRGSRRGGKKR
ncbi:MAG: hypothetical protein ACRD1H_14810 [Vicinamibacterales bacterium]